MLSQKCAQIITYLCRLAETGEFARVGELAKRYGVSERTIRYDIEKIDYFLKKNDFRELLREKGLGVRLDESAENVRRIRRAMMDSGTYQYVMTKQERLVSIVMILFDAPNCVKYDEFAESFFVSRKTAIEDVRSLKELIEEHNLKATKYGILLNMDESARRSLLMDYVLTIFTPLELWEITQDVYANISITLEREWRGILDGELAGVCEQALREAESKHGKQLSDDHYYLMVIITALALTRSKAGHGAAYCAPQNDELFPLTFFDKVSESSGLTLGGGERAFIQSEVSRILCLDEHERLGLKADLIAEQFIMRLSDAAGERYFLDETLRQSLRQHFERVLKSGLKARNTGTALQAYIEGNELLYDEVCRVMGEIGALDVIGDKEAEAVLITLHFLAAGERKRRAYNGRCRVLVVCLNGIGTAKMISAMVMKHFPEIEVFDTASVHNVDELVEKERPDFILSNIPVSGKGITVIQVSPIPSESDFAKIRAFMKTHSKEHIQGRESEYDELIRAIDETCEIKDIKTLKSKLKDILRLEKPSKAGRLREMLMPENVAVGIEALGWEDAVRKSAMPLAEAGFIEKSYIDAMIKNILEMGPYIVIVPGVALPHALPQDGVNQSCVSLAVLKNPVAFGNSVNDPVRLVFTFGSKDGKDHMSVWSELINVVGDKARVAKIAKAQSKDEVMELLYG